MTQRTCNTCVRTSAGAERPMSDWGRIDDEGRSSCALLRASARSASGRREPPSRGWRCSCAASSSSRRRCPCSSSACAAEPVTRPRSRRRPSASRAGSRPRRPSATSPPSRPASTCCSTPPPRPSRRPRRRGPSAGGGRRREDRARRGGRAPRRVLGVEGRGRAAAQLRRGVEAGHRGRQDDRPTSCGSGSLPRASAFAERRTTHFGALEQQRDGLADPQGEAHQGGRGAVDLDRLEAPRPTASSS